MDAHVIWALLIGFALTAYTVFDGFDLGVGLLLPFLRHPPDRAAAIDTITPVWDGNETWLVLAGVGLFGGFPTAYSILLPAFYLPLIVMIMGLVLRGVALEMSYAAPQAPGPWNTVFIGGSWVAAGCQGLLAGALLQGVRVEHLRFAGRPQDVLTPFALLMAGALPLVYALLGAAWLYLKTTGSLQQQVRRYARRLGWAVLGLGLVAASARQAVSPYSSATVALQLAAFAALGLAARALHRQQQAAPFRWLIVLVVLIDAAALGGLWPYLVPPRLTLWQAAAPTPNTSQLLVTSGAVVLIFGYLSYSYYVFKGKVDASHGDKRQRYRAATTQQLATPATPVRPKPHPVTLPLLAYLVLVPAGGLVFFLVIGTFGPTPALAALLLVVGVFIGAWLRYDHPDSETENPA